MMHIYQISTLGCFFGTFFTTVVSTFYSEYQWPDCNLSDFVTLVPDCCKSWNPTIPDLKNSWSSFSDIGRQMHLWSFSLAWVTILASAANSLCYCRTSRQDITLRAWLGLRLLLFPLRSSPAAPDIIFISNIPHLLTLFHSCMRLLFINVDTNVHSAN